ncbi:major facilitator superfamily transporter [Calycina marina]|uniref:Major facilitator superfamily transporter n=1 Tax=Calycina marina TaxID=1763456 RepID=A0A9P7Z4H7_9HELO|nr:major facilitator superfamily transporter [Calycina marina]
MDTSIIATALVTISQDFNGFDNLLFGSDIGPTYRLPSLQGIGGSGLYSMAMVMFPEVTPPSLSMMMSAIFGTVISMAGVLGPILGGIIARYTTWRWIFLMNVPCGVLIMILTSVAWFRHGADSTAKRITFAQMDYLGGTLLLSASVLLIFSLQEGGNREFSWSGPVLISTLVLAGVCFVLFVTWQAFLYKKESSILAIIPLRLARRRAIAASVLYTTITGFSFLVVLISLPQRFQIVNLDDTVMAGIHLPPMLISVGFGSAVGGMASVKRNNTFPIPAKMYVFEMIHGLRIGLTMSNVTLMVTVEAEFEDTAVAQGIISQARIFGGSIAIAVSSIIFNTKAQASLVNVLTPQQLSTLHKSPAVIAMFSLSEQIAARSVFAASFNETLRVCTYVSALGVVVTLFMYQKHPRDVMEKKNEMMEHQRRNMEEQMMER